MTTNNIPITTQDDFSDLTIKKTLGLVRGNTVRARNVVRNLFASLKMLFGGEIETWTKNVEDAREQALTRMREHAVEKGADAVVGMRFISTDIGQGATEILAYGTAVKLH